MRNIHDEIRDAMDDEADKYTLWNTFSTFCIDIPFFGWVIKGILAVFDWFDS
ncbi:MAG: hypothetical protein IJM96_03165 [Clostridia bacterium]|nr:hypothetical protein [Clostridia bacterium]